jgi:protein phosphatase
VITDDEFDEPDAPQASRRSGRRRRVWPVLVTVFGIGVVAVGVGGYFGWQWTQDQFFVGARGDEVVVFQGIQRELGPIPLFHVSKPTGKKLSSLSEADQALIKSGIPVTTEAEGITRINSLKFADSEPKEEATAEASPTPTPTVSATATKTKQQ